MTRAAPARTKAITVLVNHVRTVGLVPSYTELAALSSVSRSTAKRALNASRRAILDAQLDYAVRTGGKPVVKQIVHKSVKRTVYLLDSDGHRVAAIEEEIQPEVHLVVVDDDPHARQSRLAHAKAQIRDWLNEDADS